MNSIGRLQIHKTDHYRRSVANTDGIHLITRYGVVLGVVVFVFVFVGLVVTCWAEEG